MADGRLPAGAQLPPERELCEELGVSRTTLRKALAGLAADGAIMAVQGRGTYASPPRLAEPPNALLSFSRLAATKGLTASAVVINREERPATLSEAETFGVAPGSRLFELERLRMLDDLPVAIGRSLVPVAHAAAVVKQDWRFASLYEVLADAGCAPVRATYAIEAQGADAETSRLLGLPVSAPVLVTEATSFAVDGRTVEQSWIVFRGDRYRFQSTLTAPLHSSRLSAFIVDARALGRAAVAADHNSSARMLAAAE
jgi:GntR family transcriptional regulator